MPRFSFRALTALFALVAAPLLLSACDSATDGGSAEDLLIDAQIARQQGDLDGAIELLEEALAQDPDNGEVRLELAGAIFEREDIDLLTVDRIALYLTEGATSGNAMLDGSARLTAQVPPITANAGGGSCPFADDPTAEPFNPSDYPGLPQLAGSREDIELMLFIVEPLIPDELRTFDICNGIEDGELNYDREAALAEMRALLQDYRFDPNDDTANIDAALAYNSIGRLVDSYLFITNDVSIQTEWYRLEDGDIGVCVDDEDALRAQSEAAIAQMGESLLSLDLRAHLLGGEASELVDLATDAYDLIADDLGPYCDGQ